MSDIKFNCPQCGTHLAVDAAGAGMTVACPNCGQAIIVPSALLPRLSAIQNSSVRIKQWLWPLMGATALAVALIAVWFLEFRQSKTAVSQSSRGVGERLRTGNGISSMTVRSEVKLVAVTKNSPGKNAQAPNWGDATVILEECPQEMDEWSRQFEPDVCMFSWNSLFLEGVGSRHTEGVDSEYQESLGVDVSGMQQCLAKDVYGKSRTMSWGDKTAYFMSPYCSQWLNNVKGRILELIAHDGISMDNIGVPPFYKGQGGFEECAKSAFRDYMRERYSTAQLQRMGIQNIDSFDIAQYVLTHNYLQGAESALNDPVFLEFVKFNYKSNLDIWHSLVTEVQNTASNLQHSILIHGNQYGIWGPFDSNPYAILLSQYHDVIETEFVGYLYQFPPRQRFNLPYKIALASGHHRKPVWLRGITYDWRQNKPFFNSNFWKLVVAEGYANGAVRAIPPSLDTPIGTFPMPTNTLTELLHYANWAQSHKTFLTNRLSMAQVAVVYSIPTMMFREFPTIGYSDWDPNNRLSGFARALEEAHIPYDIIILGHPDLWDDSYTLSALTNYTVIALPGIDAISDGQVSALKQFVSTGGRLVITGKLGERDENFKVRPSPVLASLIHSNGCTYLAGNPDGTLYNNVVFQGQADTKDFTLMIDAVTGTNAYLRQVKSPAAPTVSFNLFRSVSNDMLFMHLVNYDYRLNNDSFVEATNISVTLTLPINFDMPGKTVTLTSPDFDSETNLAFSLVGSRLSFVIPSLRIYDVIAIGDPAYRAQKVLQEAHDKFNVVCLNDFDITGLKSNLDAADLAFVTKNYSAAAKLAESVLQAAKHQMIFKVLNDEAHNETLTVDATRASQLQPDHPEWRLLDSFQVLGYTVDRNLTLPLDFQKLKDCDLLVIACPTQPFTSNEVTAIKQFVQNGGGLIFVGDQWLNENSVNSVSQKFGLIFRAPPICSLTPLWDCGSFTITNIARHEITEGINNLTCNWGCSMQPDTNWLTFVWTDTNTWLDINGNHSLDNGEPLGPFPYCATRTFGDGRIIAVVDDAVFWARLREGNNVFGRNMVRWAASFGGPHRSLIKLAQLEIGRANTEGRIWRLQDATQHVQDAIAANASGDNYGARKLAQEAINEALAASAQPRPKIQ
jgi:DNA-directed RNA polymerase subunit RPC12/RpoP